VVRDRGGQQLTYVYFEEEPGRRSAAKILPKDKARTIAAFLIWIKPSRAPQYYR
jgi:hypothetical protein